MAKLHFFWALLALSPLALAQPAETPKPAPTAALATDYLMRELGSRLTVKQGKTIQPDKASSNIYSPEQIAAVRAVFGSSEPLVVKRLPAAGGRTNYSITLPAGQFQDEQGLSKWSQASIQLAIAPNGSQTASAGMPALSIVDKTVHLEVERMSSAGSMRADYWSGKSRGEIGKMRFMQPGAQEDEFSVDGIHFGNEFKRKGQYFGGLSEITVDRMGTQSVALDKLHVALRWRKLDAGAMATLKLEMDRMRIEGVDADKASQSLARYAPLLKRLVMLGAAVDIEDLSAIYNGHKVGIKGRLSMPNATEADFESGPAIFKKLAGQLEIAVPLPLLREVADAIARNDKSKEAAKTSPEQQSAQIYEMMLGKALANHYARLDKDVLRTTIELKDGQLAVNGNPISLDPLLALFEDKKLPPPDTEPPVAIHMRDRGLEASQLFALNGDSLGMLDMCERTADGIGIEKDPQQALTWCTKAFKKGQYTAAGALGQLYLKGELDDAAIPGMVQEAADKFKYSKAQYLMSRLLSEGKALRKDRTKADAYLLQAANQGYAEAVKSMKESDANYQQSSGNSTEDAPKDAWSYPASVEAGYISERDFRFDKVKYRRLSVSMVNLQPHEKWAPLLAVCVTAINPSDVACFNLHGNRGETPSIEVNSDIRGTESSQRTNAKWLETAFKLGEPFDLVVYARNKQVHFVVNGNETLVQDVNFPVEVLTLNCSTADCKFDFQRPD